MNKCTFLSHPLCLILNMQSVGPKVERKYELHHLTQTNCANMPLQAPSVVTAGGLDLHVDAQWCVQTFWGKVLSE